MTEIDEVFAERQRMRPRRPRGEFDERLGPREVACLVGENVLDPETSAMLVRLRARDAQRRGRMTRG